MMFGTVFLRGLQVVFLLREYVLTSCKPILFHPSIMNLEAVRPHTDFVRFSHVSSQHKPTKLTLNGLVPSFRIS